MKIAILSGSPKTKKNSLTMQYVNYLRKSFPFHEFNIFNVSREISALAPSPLAFSRIIDGVTECQAVLWAFPVYYYLVPSQYKKFIEQIFENNAHSAFHNKYAASFSTSIHAFDDIAHDYIHGICDDLNMKFVNSFSADMYDFGDPRKLKSLLFFFNNFLSLIEAGTLTQKAFLPQKKESLSFSHSRPEGKIDPSGKKILLITDFLDKKTNIHEMFKTFSGSFTVSPETVVLNDLPIRNGCIGCLACGYNNTCPLPDSTVFADLFLKISNADILVFAGEIRDRFFSSLWKLFFDRYFSCGHPPNIFTNKQIGFFVSGPLMYTPTLLRFIYSFTGTEKANLSGIITDESEDSKTISSLLFQFGQRIVSFSCNNYIKPIMFPGVGGIKVYRDDIWGRHSYVFRSDMKRYKKTRVFDLPHKKIGVLLSTRIILLLTKIPFSRRLFYRNLPGLLAYFFRKLVK